MFLFIASEVMVFGSFFAMYFFVRVVNGVPWPTPPFPCRCTSRGSTR